MTQSQVPVSILTGFLGAGKTTLLNYILTRRHGWKIAVIENEIGEVPIDNELVVSTEEDLIVFNNGCVCCTFRGDLIRSITDLLRKDGAFDAILIETTGVADPSPIVQSFFVDEDFKDRARIDAVITLVDAKHIWNHLDDSPEARGQLVYGDVVLLNKTDLVSGPDLDRLEARVRELNPLARIYRTRNAEVDLSRVLNIGAFDLSRKLEIAETGKNPRHDTDIKSITLREKGALDGKKFNGWLGQLLMSRGQDIFRLKGIVEVQGEARRVVFQGVHMMFEGRPDRPWAPDEDRTNTLVFIGRNLDAEELRKGLCSCKAV